MKLEHKSMVHNCTMACPRPLNHARRCGDGAGLRGPGAASKPRVLIKEWVGVRGCFRIKTGGWVGAHLCFANQCRRKPWAGQCSSITESAASSRQGADFQEWRGGRGEGTGKTGERGKAAGLSPICTQQVRCDMCASGSGPSLFCIRRSGDVALPRHATQFMTASRFRSIPLHESRQAQSLASCKRLL